MQWNKVRSLRGPRYPNPLLDSSCCYFFSVTSSSSRHTYSSSSSCLGMGKVSQEDPTHRRPWLWVVSGIPSVVPSPTTNAAANLRLDELLTDVEKKLDALDAFNHPRQRRSLIYSALQTRLCRQQDENDENSASIPMSFVTASSCSEADNNNPLQIYESVHSKGLRDFLVTAFAQWEALGEHGRDPSGFLETSVELPIPPLVPINTILPRDAVTAKPSSHVLGKIGYYCNDFVTPIFRELKAELTSDAAIVQYIANALKDDLISSSSSSSDENTVEVVVANTYYALVLHPGHHAARDSFGGYCYTNHAAALAKSLGDITRKTAILDVDYHCGNGSASIFYDDGNVLVVSLHCDPNYDYPFHSGFADETGIGDGANTTMHVPMPPQTTWEKAYRDALERALDAIDAFQPAVLIVSLGLDTHLGDPCAIRRAGFGLAGDDYRKMGTLMAEKIQNHIPTVFVQEGGYRMDKIADAAADVVTSFAQRRNQS